MNNGSFSNPIVIGRVITEPHFECKGADRITTFRLSDTNNNTTLQHLIISRGKQASICKQHLHVGSLCCVEGKYNSSGDAIIADRITFLNNRG